jgi:hypothetical protein
MILPREDTNDENTQQTHLLAASALKILDTGNTISDPACRCSKLCSLYISHKHSYSKIVSKAVVKELL